MDLLRLPGQMHPKVMVPILDERGISVRAYRRIGPGLYKFHHEEWFMPPPPRILEECDD